MNFNSKEIETTLQVLQQISENPTLINSHHRFKSLIAKIYKQGKKNKKQIQRQEKQQIDRSLKSQTAIVQIKSDRFPLLASHNQKIIGNLHSPKTCYICKQIYREVHFFYHSLCPTCAV